MHWFTFCNVFQKAHWFTFCNVFQKAHWFTFCNVLQRDHWFTFCNVLQRDHYEVEMPKMFDTNNDRCPVKIFQFLIIKPPVNLEISGLFYLTIIANYISFTWLWKSPMSIQKRNNIMNAIISNAPFQTSQNRLTNRKPLTIITKHSILDVAAALDPPLPIILHEKH